MPKERLLTAAVGIPLLLFLAYKGHVFWLLTVLALMFLAFREYQQLAGRFQSPFLKGLGYGGVFLCGGGAYYFQTEGLLMALFLLFLGESFFILRRQVAFTLWEDFLFVFYGVVYLGILPSFLILLRENFTFGWPLLFLVLTLNWLSDSGAYFVGKKWGKHYLAPQVSPGKTYEGLGGAFLAVFLGAVVFYVYAPLFTFPVYFFFALFTVLFGQAGDLWASYYKRLCGVKDAGSLLPGHGGILDRFDSLFFVAPFAYYYFLFLA